MYGIPFKSSTMETVFSAVDSSHYHVACTEVFKYSHGGEGLEDGDSVSHPNQYAAWSRVLGRKGEEKAKAQREGEEAKPKVEIEIEGAETKGGDAMMID